MCAELLVARSAYEVVEVMEVVEKVAPLYMVWSLTLLWTQRDFLRLCHAFFEIGTVRGDGGYEKGALRAFPVKVMLEGIDGDRRSSVSTEFGVLLVLSWSRDEVSRASAASAA